MSDPVRAEAARVLTLCNACNYCDGYCDLFRQAELQRSFTAADLSRLAALCHQCGACLPACQFAPPHPFAVDLPAALTAVRTQDQAGTPRRTALLWGLLLLGCGGGWELPDLKQLWSPAVDLAAARQSGPAMPGDFYAVLSWDIVSGLAGLALLAALLLLVWQGRQFARHVGLSRDDFRSGGWPGLRDALTLRNLGGGGAGCPDGGGGLSGFRRLAHHLLTGGFALCFAATSVATLYHHLLDWPAPYPLTSLPVLLGTAGGVLMLAGCAGLGWARARLPRTSDAGEGWWLLILLAGVAGSGLVLLALRESLLMPRLLGLHLALVLLLFVTIPVGKMLHGLYRLQALIHTAAHPPPAREGTMP